MDKVEGYKTYIVFILLIVLAVLRKSALIDQSDFDLALSILIGGGLAALRVGMKTETEKVKQKIDEKVGP